jgi:DNA-directed RNA polymerase subunit RPC12/RpoP
MQCINCKQILYSSGYDMRITCPKCAVKYRVNIVGKKIRQWLDGGSNTIVGLYDTATGEPLGLGLPNGLDLPFD